MHRPALSEVLKISWLCDVRKICSGHNIASWRQRFVKVRGKWTKFADVKNTTERYRLDKMK